MEIFLQNRFMDRINFGLHIQMVTHSAYAMNVGDKYDIVVKRKGEEIELTGYLLPRITRHVFEEMEPLSQKQIFMREQWAK
jgi:hypothetical protein